ncbi:EamA family transporter [Sphingobacterium haloxyli]|uniref:Permease n=1 Tax=Sphingobacterium haloxyli TaxID=2100533 RepID=A0A2S9IZT9_9SPHI|nr:EamA family transporter [Sphingobacterium haloxyli]PRD46046.1 permease [Sphingobacterium haloxyli]
MEQQSEKTESRKKYFLAAFFAPLIWGFMAISVRWVKEYSAEDILYYRILVALIILWLFIFLFRRKFLRRDTVVFKKLPRRRQNQTIGLSILASALIFGNWFTYIYAVNHISVQSAAFAYLVCPLITAIAAFFILKEQLSSLKRIALGIALISAVTLATGSFIDVLWSMSIASLYALYLIVQRASQGFDKLNMLAVQLTLCSIFVIPKLFMNQHTFPKDPFFWFSILTIAVVFTIIPLFFSMYALTRISSSTTGVLLYVNPLIAFTLAVTYFQETVAPHKYLAYIFILFAIVLFNWGTLNKFITKVR